MNEQTMLQYKDHLNLFFFAKRTPYSIIFMYLSRENSLICPSIITISIQNFLLTDNEVFSNRNDYHTAKISTLQLLQVQTKVVVFNN